MLRRAGLIGFALASSAQAQTIATSPGPSAVSVTVYRAPDRQAAEKIQLDWLRGYALISETRTIDIPAGEADIRFEGVAGGILPESAIVGGLPDGVAEKNQDAYLLSPASLLDRSLGRRVRLRRTSRATGTVREEEAVVLTGADGGVVLQTAAGYEALRCTGLTEAIVYASVPQGLSAKPTLSVRTVSRARTRATVTLSYLASGFDWQANYVGTLSPDGTRMDLFAWVTLANGDETSFAEASTQAVAGRLSRKDMPGYRERGEPLRLRCFPTGSTTSDLRRLQAFDAGEEIVVTGMRVSSPQAMIMPAPPPPEPPAAMARQEELGDLKLYRIPQPVTVAAKSQKQVALLTQPRVSVSLVYRRRLYGNDDPVPVPASRVYVTRNRVAEGLGLPLPAGPVAIFTRRARRPILVGEGAIDDRAVGEDVEIVVADATGVLTQVTAAAEPNAMHERVLTATNDRPVPVAFEAEFQMNVVDTTGRANATLEQRDGRPLWRTTIPANGRVALRYRAID